MLQTAACSRLRKRVNPLVFTRRYEHLRNRISYAEIYKIWDIKYIRERERNSWVKTLSWQTRERRSNDESKISSILDRTSCAHEHTLFLDRNSREYRITILWQCRWFTMCVTLNFQHASHTLCSFTQQIAPCIERRSQRPTIAINPITDPAHLFPPFSIAQSRMWTFYFSSSKSLEKNFKNSQHFRCYGEISRSSPFLLHSYRSMDLIVDRKRRKSTKEERKKKNKESIDTDDRAWPRFCFRLYSKGGKGEFSQGKAELNVTGSEQTFAIHARYLPHHLVDYL